MNRVFICGLGAVSPAGWGVSPLYCALARGEPIPAQTLARPGLEKPLWVRPVPPPETRPAFFMHPRLRRAGVITQHAVAAALEALGDEAARIQSGAMRLGIVVCTLAGSVAYSRRFYEEVLREPATASPVIFPETVFNAPASHLAAYLDTSAASYTLVGDEGAFLQGLAVAADWLQDDHADGVLVIGVEEMDWIVAESVGFFQRRAIHSAGAGAVYLKKEKTSEARAELAAVTDSFLFTQNQSPAQAAQKMRGQLPKCGPDESVILSAPLNPRAEAAESSAWQDWSGNRLAPKPVLSQAFTASAAWQCVAACEAIARDEFAAVNVSVVGANQAIGARFLACAKTV
jgi:3-Oxoacyl-[acyl-carrier-protein (ACP)] synthase III